MTLEEKNRIAEMRRAGIGYKKIAQELGASENTIKTFCRRNGLTGADMETTGEITITVTQCGKMVPQYPGRKEKKFCTDDCRNRWWNLHLGEVKRKSMSDHTCPACGKVFSAYDNRHRKYCSHECYITDRFGGAACV